MLGLAAAAVAVVLFTIALLEHLASYSHLIYRIERSADGEGRAQYAISLSTTTKRAVARGAAPTLALAACRAALNTLPNP